jgi:alpha-beta hydrolase superfamily lysophospholipase
VGRAYDADPLVYKTITPRWYTEMLASQARVLAEKCPVPLALFVGDADPITSVAADRDFARSAGAPIKEYPGMLHEIFNEIGKEQVVADVADWLDA